LLHSLSIAIDNAGIEYLAYGDGFYSDFKTTVVKYNSGISGYEIIGKAGLSTGSGLDNSIKIDSNGFPYVIYRDAGFNYKTVVKKLSGEDWIIVGDDNVSKGRTHSPSLALNSNNTPYVAYIDDGNESRVTVKRVFDGKWRVVGKVGFTNKLIRNVKILIDSNNTPYVIFVDNNATSDKYTV